MQRRRLTLPLLHLLSLLAVASPAIAQGQTGTVTGRVTDQATGTPVAGATVSIVGTPIGTVSGADGGFTLSRVPSGTREVQASMIGYSTGTAVVEVRADATTTVDLQLQTEALQLEGIVAVGYGTQRRRDLTGSISSVTAEELQRAPAVFQGRVPGVEVTQASAAPGGGVSVRIRGSNSIAGGNEPLFVIDGFPVYNDGGRGMDDGISQVDPNPLAGLNPNDIQSIEVLKDASATAIYGSRGANGVVLVTTRRGAADGRQVNFEMRFGVQRVAKRLDLLNAEQFKAYLNDYAVNQGSPDMFGDLSRYTADTDWQSEVFQTAPVQEYTASVSGGTETTRVYASGSVLDQRGIIRNSGMSRYSFRANLDHAVSDRITVATNLSLGHVVHDRLPTSGGSGVSSGVIDGTLGMAPFVPVRGTDGAFARNWLDESETANPVAYIEDTRSAVGNDRLIGNTTLRFNLLEGLTLRIAGGVDFDRRDSETFYPRSTLRGANINSGAYDTRASVFSWLNENVLEYDARLGADHALNLTTGVTLQEERYKVLNVFATDFVSENLEHPNIGAGEGVGSLSSGRTEWALASWLGRVNYGLLDRYLLTVSARADGSSKFGAQNQWGFFPSAAIAWIVSDERFLRQLGVFDHAKLRASYGVTGNQEIGVYQSLARLGVAEYLLDGKDISKGLGPTSIANPDLSWESTSQLNVGVDAAFLSQRLRLSADYYRKLTDDLLLSVRLPANSGFSSALKNVGSVENTGFELAVGGDILSDDDLLWGLDVTYSRNRNEVVDLGETTEFLGSNVSTYIQTPGHIIREGEPLGAFFGFIYDGTFKSDEEVQTHGAQPAAQPGDARYLDLNDDGSITSADRTVIGSPHPDYTFGINNRFRYRNVELSASLRGVIGADVLNFNRMFLAAGDRDHGSRNKASIVLDRWSSENPGSDIPRAGSQPLQRPSTFEVEDGSFIRLSNVRLGYRLPPGVFGVRSSEVFLAVQNLFTITDYSGYNPEVSSAGLGNVNLGIDRVPSIEMDPELRAQLVAEARFLRALHYFNLVRMWGPVPLEVNETVDLTELEKGRAPTNEVYELIIEDLIAAEPDLPVTHPAADGGRATRGAARGLLAKVYLTLASEQRFDAYPGRTYAEPAESYYQKAADEAQSVIDLGAYALFPAYAHVFREEHENGSEHIFSVNFDRDNLVSEQGFGLFLAPQGVAHTEFPERGTSWMWTSDEFFERFPDGDYRKDVTFVTEAPSLDDGTAVPYTGWQFPHPHIDKYWTRNAFNDNRLVIRYADVLLMRAEALNELQGPNPQAIDLVNEVRARARNGDPSAAPQDHSEADVGGQDRFRELIWEERLWELAFEMHRWFDLSRTSRLVRTVRDAYDGALPISEKHKLFPIPASQLLVNRELEQNPEW